MERGKKIKKIKKQPWGCTEQKPSGPFCDLGFGDPQTKKKKKTPVPRKNKNKKKTKKNKLKKQKKHNCKGGGTNCYFQGYPGGNPKLKPSA